MRALRACQTFVGEFNPGYVSARAVCGRLRLRVIPTPTRLVCSRMDGNRLHSARTAHGQYHVCPRAGPRSFLQGRTIMPKAI